MFNTAYSKVFALLFSSRVTFTLFCETKANPPPLLSAFLTTLFMLKFPFDKANAFFQMLSSSSLSQVLTKQHQIYLFLQYIVKYCQLCFLVILHLCHCAFNPCRISIFKPLCIIMKRCCFHCYQVICADTVAY